jgi:hypothetical protein
VTALEAAGRHAEAEAEARSLCDGDLAKRGFSIQHYAGALQLNSSST